MGRFYAWLILAVLAVLVALEIYGFRTSHLFSQEIWDPEGRARLLQFAALYLAAATALLILVPWAFAGLAAALLLVLTAIAIGPLAFLAVVFFLLSAWSAGLVDALGRCSHGPPVWRRHSCLPCRDSSRHLFAGATPCRRQASA
jgi:hypothetical protein